MLLIRLERIALIFALQYTKSYVKMHSIALTFIFAVICNCRDFPCKRQVNACTGTNPHKFLSQAEVG